MFSLYRKYDPVQLPRLSKDRGLPSPTKLPQWRQEFLQKARRGRPPKISTQQQRALARAGRQGKLCSHEIKEMYELTVGVQHVQQMLRDYHHFEYKKLKNVPFLTEEHKFNRMKCARSHLREDAKIFSDEKRFSMAGTDGFAHFWADKRMKKSMFRTRQRGFGGVMAWG